METNLPLSGVITVLAWETPVELHSMVMQHNMSSGSEPVEHQSSRRNAGVAV